MRASSDRVPAHSTAPSASERRPFEEQLLKIVPELRAFARFLGSSPQDADDLVQDTVLRALDRYRLFDLNTNIRAWCFTILRNIRINSFRKRRFEELDADMLEGLSVNANQETSVELQHVLRALDTLTPAHREVVTLVRMSGFSYDEAAEIMGCKIGTIKSRVNRADAALRTALGAEFQETRPCGNDERESA